MGGSEINSDHDSLDFFEGDSQVSTARCSISFLLSLNVRETRSETKWITTRRVDFFYLYYRRASTRLNLSRNLLGSLYRFFFLSDTYYLRDRFVPFPCDVELTVAAPITPAASSLLDGFVSPPLLSGGSFLFSNVGMYSAHY